MLVCFCFQICIYFLCVCVFFVVKGFPWVVFLDPCFCVVFSPFILWFVAGRCWVA